tara:strand:- start:376 stop:738 length:363 start_codon:yes stop_codon:yes gene_type:complete
MSDEQNSQNPDNLIPKLPSKLAPEGIRTFTVCRRADETGISGEGVVIEGVVLGTGQCIVHWLYPPPRGGIAVFDSMEDFLKVHVLPHPTNKTIITFADGEQNTYPPPPIIPTEKEDKKVE